MSIDESSARGRLRHPSDATLRSTFKEHVDESDEMDEVDEEDKSEFAGQVDAAETPASVSSAHDAI